jgi:hypothetical protein
MGLASRLSAPTPTFFKTLRSIGLVLAAISASVVAAPIAVPLIVTQVAGYLAVAGGVLTAVSQTAVAAPPVYWEEDNE